MGNKEYAVYKGDELLVMGTLKECAERLGINEESVLFYDSTTYKRRTSENARRLVRLED